MAVDLPSSSYVGGLYDCTDTLEPVFLSVSSCGHRGPIEVSQGNQGHAERSGFYGAWGGRLQGPRMPFSVSLCSQCALWWEITKQCD